MSPLVPAPSPSQSADDEIILEFNLERISEFRRQAVFATIEEKNAYCDAEAADRKCQNAYLEYSGARAADRRSLARRLDVTRHTFYKRWREKSLMTDKGKAA
jgi:hypothetical protein